MSTQYPVLIAISTVGIVIIIVVALIIICLLWALAVYNRLVRKRQSCKESWSDIDTELKRRHDLIPNLVNTVKGYAAHESGVMEEVTKLRNDAVQVQDKGPGARSKVEGKLAASVGTLIARAEAYPDLKASANFLELQQELSETETRIARSRRFYNSNVREFHNGCQVIPASIIASIGGFKESEFDFFQVDGASERDPVDVKFDNSPTQVSN